MSAADRKRWDKKWAKLLGKSFKPHVLLAKYEDLLSGGVALDVACGLGQNSIWLAMRDYHVLGIDISGVALSAALHQAKQAGVSQRSLFVQMDIADCYLDDALFDLICIFRFLERRTFSGIRKGLKRGGLLVIATRHVGLCQWQPDANKDYLLERGELRQEFGDWEILHYDEGVKEASIIARKI